MGDTLERVRVLVEGLTVDEARMRRNLDLSGGLILGEALMLRLGESIGRQEAHDVIYDAAQAAAMGEVPFLDLLTADERVTEHLSPADLEGLLDPAAYTGHCALVAQVQAERADALASELSS